MAFNLFQKYRKIGLIWLFFALATIILLWPLLPNMATHLTSGGDPLFLSAIMNLERKHLLKGEFSSFFNINTFFPYTNSLVYTDHSLTLVLMSLPLTFFTNNPIFTYNAILFSSWFLTGLGGFYLTRYYTKSYKAGLVGGFIFAFNPFHYAHLIHLNILSYQFIPFALLFFEKAVVESRKRNYFFFTLFALAATAVSFYHLAQFAILLAIIFTFRLITMEELRNWRKVLLFSLCFSLIAIINLPLIFPYLQFSSEMNIKRNIDEVMFFSASIIDYFIASPYNKLYGFTSQQQLLVDPYFNPAEFPLFLGFAIYFLALSGFVRLKSKTRFKLKGDQVQRMYLIIGVVAFVLSLGPYLAIANSHYLTFSGQLVPLPYLFFYQNITLFQGLRVPTRFLISLTLALAVLGAIAFNRLNTSKNQLAKRIGMGLVIVMFLEFLSFPIEVNKIAPLALNESYTFLAQQEGKDWGIFEFPSAPITPIPSFNLNSHIPNEIQATYFSSVSGKKMLNGYSGFEPEGKERLQNFTRANFNLQTSMVVNLLGGLKIRFLLIDGERIEDTRYREELLSNLAKNSNSILVYQKGLDYIYRLADQSKELSNNPDISFSAPETTVSEGVLYAKVVIRNNSDKVWTNPDMGKYEFKASIENTITRRTLAKPLYLLPQEEIQQLIKIDRPFLEPVDKIKPVIVLNAS